MAIEFNKVDPGGVPVTIVMVDGELVGVIASVVIERHTLFSPKGAGEIHSADTLDEMKAFCREHFA